VGNAARLEAAGADALELNVYYVSDPAQGCRPPTSSDASPDQLRGRLSQRTIRHPQAWERANYLRTLASPETGNRDG